MRKQMEKRKRGMHEMKNTILSFALPLLLASSPAAFADARILWTDVDGAAVIVAADGTETPASQYQASGKSVNAFRVAVPDESSPGATNYLVFVYEGQSGATIVGDSAPTARSLDLANGGAAWAPVDLAGYVDPDQVVTMEFGYLDWAAFDAGYDEDDPSTWNVPFTTLAFATETIGGLLGSPHVTLQSDLNPPAATPWAPERFVVVALPPPVRTTVISVALAVPASSRFRRRPGS